MKALIIYNPKSGKNSKRYSIQEIKKATDCLPFEINIKQTNHRGHAEKIAEKSGGDYDILICCGGDGTFSEMINGLLKGGHSETRVSYFPMGSTNDMAKTIGMPTKLHEAFSAIKEQNVNSLDVGSFNDRYFSYIASFGPGTSVSYSTPQWLKNRIGYSAYMLNAFGTRLIPILKEVKPKHIKIEYDGKSIEDDFYFGAVSNTLSVAGMFQYDKNNVRLNDGKFEVILVRRIKHPTDTFKMIRRIKKRQYDGETLLYFQASELHFEFKDGVAWTLDGEYAKPCRDISLCVKKGGLQIISPENSLFIKDKTEIQV